MKKTLCILLSLCAAFGLATAAEYSLPQLKADTVASYMAANDTFFLKSDWIGGCGGADITYLALRKAIGETAGIPFVVANWGDYQVFRALGISNPGLNYFIRVGGKTYGYYGPRVYWSVYEWACGILAQHGKTAGIVRQPQLRVAPDTGGTVALDDGLSNLYSFDNGSRNSLVAGGNPFDTLDWSRYLRNNVLDIYHGYMSETGVERPRNFTSGLDFVNQGIRFDKGFSMTMEFRPYKTKNEIRVFFHVGVSPLVALRCFKGTNYLAIETDQVEYGVNLPDMVVKIEEWNTLAFSYDPAAGRVRIRLNGQRLRDVVLPNGLAGGNVGSEAEAVVKKYGARDFSFVYGRAGDILTAQIDNLAFWTRPLSGAELDRATAWVRGRTGSGSAPLGSDGGSGNSGSDGSRGNDPGVVPPED